MSLDTYAPPGMTVHERLPALTRAAGRLRAFSQKRSGHVTLLIVAALGWAALWAWFDYMVVRLAFPPPLNPSSSTLTYWTATWGFLFPLATLLAFRGHAWMPYLAVMAGAWEDVLFYWIQLVPVPPSVALWFYARAAVFLPVAVLGEIASHRLPVRHRLVALVALAAVGAVFNVEWLALTGAAIVVYLVLTNLADLLQSSGGSWRPMSRAPKAP